MNRNNKAAQLLLVLLLLISGAIVPWSQEQVSASPAASAQAQRLTFVVRPRAQIPLPTLSRYSMGVAGLLVDASGNQFRCIKYTLPENGNDTRVVCEKRNNQGVHQTTWEAVPVGIWKINEAAAFWSLDKVVIEVTGYRLDQGGTRDNDVGFVEMPLGFDHGNGRVLRQAGGASVFQVNTPVPGPPPEPVNYNRIRDEVTASVMASLKQEIAGSPTGSIRQAIEDKAKDAVGESFDRALYFTDVRAHYAQDAAGTFVRDRAYEAVRSWHLDNPCAPPPTLTPTAVPTATRTP